jgi:cytoskeleton protein RodZ
VTDINENLENEVQESIAKEEKVISPKIGEIISKARKARKQKLIDIASHLKIRRIYLEAIENCEYKKLPEAPYGLGFIKSYSDYLGLDVNEIVNQYKEETSCQEKKKVEYAVLEPENDASAPTKGYVIASAIFIAIIYTIWAGSSITSDDNEIQSDVIYQVSTINQNEDADIADEGNQIDTFDSNENVSKDNLEILNKEISAEKVKSVEEVKQEIVEKEVAEIEAEEGNAAETVNEEKDIEVKEEVVKAPHVPQEYGVSNKDESEVVIIVTKASWVEIKDDDKIILTRVLEKGDKFYAPVSNNLTLSTGNAGGFNIIFDGEVASPIGPSGAVRKEIPLTRDYLFADEH